MFHRCCSLRLPRRQAEARPSHSSVVLVYGGDVGRPYGGPVVWPRCRLYLLCARRPPPPQSMSSFLQTLHLDATPSFDPETRDLQNGALHYTWRACPLGLRTSLVDMTPELMEDAACDPHKVLPTAFTNISGEGVFIWDVPIEHGDSAEARSVLCTPPHDASVSSRPNCPLPPACLCVPVVKYAHICTTRGMIGALDSSDP